MDLCQNLYMLLRNNPLLLRSLYYVSSQLERICILPGGGGGGGAVFTRESITKELLESPQRA